MARAARMRHPVRDMPPADFYKLAGDALFRGPGERRRSKQVAVRLGDSCFALMHECWIKCARYRPERAVANWAASTLIYNGARWSRSRVFQRASRSIPLYRCEQLSDELAYDTSDEVDEDVTRTLLHERVQDVLRSLTYRERTILEMHYGLADGYAYSLEAIGRVLHITRDRVRQIESKAIAKLRGTLRASKLLGFAPELTRREREAEASRQAAAIRTMHDHAERIRRLRVADAVELYTCPEVR